MLRDIGLVEAFRGRKTIKSLLTTNTQSSRTARGLRAESRVR